MTEQDKIYLASLLDNGSYFALRPTNGTVTAVIRIARQTDFQLQELHKIFGGHLGWSKTSSTFYLNFNGRDCSRVLILVLPYLRVKNRHAQILIEFNNQVKDRVDLGVAGRKLTEQERAWRAQKAEELKALNR